MIHLLDNSEARERALHPQARRESAALIYDAGVSARLPLGDKDQKTCGLMPAVAGQDDGRGEFDFHRQRQVIRKRMHEHARVADVQV